MAERTLEEDLARLRALLDELSELAAEQTRLLEELKRQVDAGAPEARYGPLGDNHHNAMACPHCNPERIDPVTLQAEAERLRDGFEAIAALCTIDAGEWNRRWPRWAKANTEDLPYRIAEEMLGQTEEATAEEEHGPA